MCFVKGKKNSSAHYKYHINLSTSVDLLVPEPTTCSKQDTVNNRRPLLCLN